jgi:N4-gp56 family major capsid protein
MADTTTATGLRVQQWDEDFFVEFINSNIFSAYMGTDENSLIQIKENLTKKKGDSVTFALVNRLTNQAITGSNTLEGNEEDLGQRSHRVYVDKWRHAVRFSEMEEQKNAINLREAARASLMTYKQEFMRDRVIAKLGDINGVAYATASEVQKDAWLVDNVDRVVFGAATSGGTDHSADLLLLDTAADLLTPTMLSLLRRKANAASPKIRPIRVEDGRYYYVAFTGARAFRDLKTNATITQAQREVTLKNQNNKLFQGGDVEWDGIIVREVPDIGVISGVGAAGADVGPIYLCGAQALGYALARRPKTVTKEFDYGDKYGVAIDTIDGLEKLIFGTGTADTDDTKMNGVVTGYAAVAAGA